MVKLCVDIVERTDSLLDVVMTTLEDITCSGLLSGDFIFGIIGIVCCIDSIPVDLRGLVITCLPKMNEVVILLLINSRTYEVTIVTHESFSKSRTIGTEFVTNKQTPWIVTVIIVELIVGVLDVSVRVHDLTVPHSGRQVAVIIRSGVRRIVEIDCRVGIE